MELQEKNIKIRKLISDEGKMIVSKEMQKDEKGKEIYLGKEDSEENYIEVNEEENDGSYNIN